MQTHTTWKEGDKGAGSHGRIAGLPVTVYSYCVTLWQAALAVLAIPLAGLTQQPPAGADPFAAVRFLQGSWRGEQAGQPGTGTSERTYEFILNGRFLQGRNKSTYPPQEKNKAGEVHNDMGMIGYDKARKKLVFRQFHVEGFVNTYVQQESSDPNTIVFLSESIENIPAGWRARETYSILNQDEFIERFDVAEPGKDFELYAQAHLRRSAAAKIESRQ